MRDTTRSNGTAVGFRRFEGSVAGQNYPTPVLIVTYVFRRASLIRNLARPRPHGAAQHRSIVMYPIMPLETTMSVQLLVAFFAMISATFTWVMCGRA